MILGLVTLLGFAVDRESWGLASLGLIIELALLYVMERGRRVQESLLGAAGDIESVKCGDSDVTDAHLVMFGLGRSGRSHRVPTFILVGVIVMHVGLNVLLAVWFDWSFTGRSS